MQISSVPFHARKLLEGWPTRAGFVSFPRHIGHRCRWSRRLQRTFYVIYSFVVMGAVTVYEWDLLFPDILDIFVLSVLPIPSRKLFFARVLALAICSRIVPEFVRLR